MQHLGERITDYIFGELPASEMAEAQRHLSQCADCAMAVEQFQHTHSMLKASPDLNPPRSVVFEFEKPATNRFWKWVAPVAAAAVLLLGVALLAQVHIQWKDSQLTIAFGQILPPVPQPAVASQPLVVERAVTEPVDYARIEKWINDELRRKSAGQTKEILRLQGQLAYLESLQLVNERNIMATESSFQLLASRSPSEN